MEGNRAFVDLTFRRADDSDHSARFRIDTGGGALLLSENLARDLGVEWGDTLKERGQALARLDSIPAAFLGGMPLDVVTDRAFVILGADNLLPETAPGHADGMIPGHVLARYHVVLDYPNRMLALATPGTVQPIGEPLPMPVSEPLRFPRTEIQVDGTTYGFLLDTGASFTMVSEATLRTWGGQHPEWSRYDGAEGDAVTLGGQTLETMIVPGGQWGSREIPRFGVVSQQEGVFEQRMSRLMTSAIIGALGGNVLQHFRIELDYAGQILYLSRPEPGSPR